MIAKAKAFLKPQTTEEMQRRIILVLAAAIAAIFVSLLVVKYQQSHPSANVIRFTDGDTTLELAADNTVTIRKAPLATR